MSCCPLPHVNTHAAASPFPSSSPRPNDTNTNTISSGRFSLPFRQPPTVLEIIRGDPDEGDGPDPRTASVTPSSSSSSSSDHHYNQHQAVVVVRGLPRDVVEAALAEGLVPAGWADRFVRKCLARRRPWRPVVIRGRGGGDGAGGNDGGGAASGSGGRNGSETRGQRLGGYVWEYPEVVELEGGGIAFGGGVRDGDVDGALPPPVMPLLPRGGAGEEREGRETGNKRLGVVFCRAGLWFGKERSVLFLDRDPRDGQGQGRRRARRSAGVAAGAASAADADADAAGEAKTETGAEGEVKEDLEDMVTEMLRSNPHAVDMLPTVVAEAAYHQWLVLFDFLEPHPRVLDEATMACYLRMLRSLELNDEADDGDTVWRRLLVRLLGRIQLLSSASPVASLSTPRAPTVSGTTGEMANISKRRITSQPSTTGEFCLVPCRHGPIAQRALDENRKALDRLGYLAGILSPLPIVSGILSMGNGFGPYGDKFFVFWAVAVPLAGLVLLLIHADTIRKAEVWVEIGSDRVVPISPGKTRDGEDRPSPGLLRHHAVPFVVDHEAEERNLDMPTMTDGSAILAGEPEDGDRPRRRRWSTGWEQVPAVILERPADGSKPRAWKREQLSWYGAIMAILLFRRLRDGSHVPEGVAACEKAGRCRTKSC
ncbi:hypothetical protein MYCTH_2145572 [Thermothelomyces thermophilus ATCC 42464]|uniref:Uncharacterized protein n=1 Tax=Thermothelomyces thermophilus (strain ATCC 42464 / BCRC 31852 / DSM 1799) TaxID=573729 RepID=G2QQ02_THET4|nr:uncharacterized protein MYCTH_2145572 [Thermothelomyces thermophilus ATCC 42464]AEO61665.1 hypothetical protein MYCTH_2145572 [Thermothelomyces thermophilus ATCC 42464]